MQKEKEEEKEEGKHRGYLFQAEVVSLQGLCTHLCQTEGDKTPAGYFLMHYTLERSTNYVEHNEIFDVNFLVKGKHNEAHT